MRKNLENTRINVDKLAKERYNKPREPPAGRGGNRKQGSFWERICHEIAGRDGRGGIFKRRAVRAGREVCRQAPPGGNREAGMARCKECGREIVWVRMASGKAMPCDPRPVGYVEVFAGREKIVTPSGQVVSAVEAPLYGDVKSGVGYRSHFSTCPHAKSSRKVMKG